MNAAVWKTAGEFLPIFSSAVMFPMPIDIIKRQFAGKTPMQHKGGAVASYVLKPFYEFASSSAKA